MAGITDLATTFDLPNYHGELFALTPTTTPFLSAIGGLTGGRRATGATETEWQAFDLRDADLGRQRVEGADAPTAAERVRMNLSNVLEIHQEAVSVSYTKQAATQMYSGINVGAVDNPVNDENAWQIRQAIAQIALDVDLGFMYGVYNKPDDNTTARSTRGLRPAIVGGVNSASSVVVAGGSDATLSSVPVTASSGVFTKTHALAVGDKVTVEGGEAVGIAAGNVYTVRGVSTTVSFTLAAADGTLLKPSADFTATVYIAETGDTPVVLTEDLVNDLLQKVWENGGVRDNNTATLIAGATQKRALTTAFITNANYRETSRTVGGVAVSMIESDFGTLNIMLSRHVRNGDLIVCSLEQCSPVILEIPGKGFLFVEPLAQTGASIKNQLYGEIGLEYGNPLAHGLLTGLSA